MSPEELKTRIFQNSTSFQNSSLAVGGVLVLTPRMHEEIKLTREVNAIQIPSGDSLSLPAGTAVFITQRLGGTYTVATSQGLARISSQDADALGVNPEEELKKSGAHHCAGHGTWHPRAGFAAHLRPFLSR